MFAKNSLRYTMRNMPPTRKHVRDVETLRALAHPLRLRLLGLLRVAGPATASELARQVGESSGSTSYHLRQLARYGFVVEDEEQPSKRERRWRAAHQVTSWDNADFAADPAGRDAAGAIQRYQLGLLAEHAERFHADPERWVRGWIGASGHSDWTVRLTAEALEELRERVDALLEEYEARCAGEDDAELVAVHLAAYPFRSPA